MINMADELRQNDTFAISKKDLAQLMYVFSHDLRNPLINMSALLSDMRMSLVGAAEDTPALSRVMQDDCSENLDMMVDVVAHMNTLVAGANDIYHCMFDDLEVEAIELSTWIERILARYATDFSEKSMTVTANDLSIVWADPLAMERIITALLDNALHFTPEGGHISLRTERHEDLDVLVVQDNGMGMSESDIQRVFQPFFTTDDQRAGMGLAVVKSLLQAHHGQVWCESSIGKGATFYIGFPHRMRCSSR